jgi:hypothetical protein
VKAAKLIRDDSAYQTKTEHGASNALPSTYSLKEIQMQSRVAVDEDQHSDRISRLLGLWQRGIAIFFLTMLTWNLMRYLVLPTNIH